MDRQQIGMKLALDALGIPLKLSTFNDRLILQKAIYLAQAGGIHLGYSYRWYLRGPYSPGLTRDAFSAAGEIDREEDESAGWTLDAGSQGRAKRLRDLIGGEAPRRKRSERLELLASVHYLVTRGYNPPKSPAQVAAALQNLDKPFAEDSVSEALKELQKYGLLENA